MLIKNYHRILKRCPLRFFLALVVGLFLTASCKKNIPEYVAIAYEELPETIQFSIHVKPILSDKCYLCHGPDEDTRKAQLRFDTEEGLYQKSSNENFAFFPRNLNKSEAIERILSDDPEFIMPPSDAHLSLSPREKSILIKWVEQGAKWTKHWAFIPPEKSEIPKIENNWKPQNEIDNFVFEKLIQNDLELSEQATKEQLLRRITIDLTGLPPTITELNSFLNDTSEKAYETLVDRLLNTDAHAERLTLEWMDLARYSDSHGYHADGLRMMWQWRDWVIQSFKENKPYSDFVTEQVAGDLIPNATKDQVLATGFNRNHPMTAEGGAIDEEWRIDYVSNRTNTFGTAFLGLSLECAKCHDHKFDPISQENYYELFAFFNNNRELGMTFEDGNFGPLALLSTDEEDEKIFSLKTKIDSLDKIKSQTKEVFIKEANFKDSNNFIESKPILHHDFEKISKTKELSYLDNIKGTELGKDVELLEGMVGLAPNFDNQYDRIDVKKIKAFEFSDPFSVSIWVSPGKRPAEGTSMTIIGNSSIKGELYKGWDLHIDYAGQLSARLISVLPNNYMHIKTPETIPLNEWTHVLMTYDGSSKARGLHVYLNGKETPHTIEYDNLFKTIIPRNRGNLIIGKSPRGQSGDNGIFIGKIDQLSIYDTDILPLQVAQLYEQSKLGKEPVVYRPNDPTYLEMSEALAGLQKEKLEVITPIKETMVMEEMFPRRKTYILERGEYNKPGMEVQRGVPDKILGFSAEYSKDRFGLSKWLFDKNNPLTARVAVNRYWQMIFGRGLVATANDFGNQGSMPSHPELLDWLAINFVESGWDLRELIRKMVTSTTYKQSSKANSKLRELDPNNELLARGPSYRLQAEFIRNNALTSSGLLNPIVGGESVRPYQPEGLWIAGNFSAALAKYVQDHDEKQYRRTMYTFVKRTAPPPYMTIFDMPTRDICIVSREQTNTPLQALSLLNDPQFVEAAKALAVRMKIEGGNTVNEQIEMGFQLAVSRKPSENELMILSDLYKQEFDVFEKDESSALAYLSVGDYKLPDELEAAEMAALTIIANTLFNMDEMYTKR
jgi:hypothetical protein